MDTRRLLASCERAMKTYAVYGSFSTFSGNQNTIIMFFDLPEYAFQRQNFTLYESRTVCCNSVISRTPLGSFIFISPDAPSMVRKQLSSNCHPSLTNPRIDGMR